MDARVIRTRTAIQEALFALVQEQRWEKITVQDLLDRTGISRSTFYAHYDNKLDVLTGEVPHLGTMITADSVTGSVELSLLFEHADEMAPVITPLLSQPVLGDISRALEDGFAEAFARVVDVEVAPTLPRFLAGAMLATIRTYLADGDRPTPTEMASKVERHVNAAIAAP